MKVVCTHCGLPFSITRPAAERPVYCCSGCALAARLTADGTVGRTRSAGPLVAALTIGFVAFNHVLFWLLAVLLDRRDEIEGAAFMNPANLLWASIGAGGVAWLAIVIAQWRLGARRMPDLAVGVLCVMLLALGIGTISPSCVLFAGVLQAGWALRGIVRKRPIVVAISRL